MVRGGRGGSRVLPTSRSVKAGVNFPVGRIHRHMKRGKYSSRIGAGAPVYLAAVLEYLAAEVLELAGNAARDQHPRPRKRIIPRHIMFAVYDDDELRKFSRGTIIAGGGVRPCIHSEMFTKKIPHPYAHYAYA